MWTIVGICLIIASGSSAFYSPSDDVVKLTAANFEDSVLNSDKVWVVEFYATWCRFSRELAPTYRQVATALKGFVPVGAIDCEENQFERDVCNRIYINHYPTILIFGANKYAPLEYNGEDTVKDISSAALREFEKISAPLFQINAANPTFLVENAHK